VESGQEVDPNHPSTGTTPLLVAARHGDLATTQLPLEKGANPLDITKSGYGLLRVAACGGNIEAIDLVLSIPRHDWINTTSTAILTPLMIAVQERNVTATKNILEGGANSNNANVRGGRACNPLLCKMTLPSQKFSRTLDDNKCCPTCLV